jgi:hypothetical protein
VVAIPLFVIGPREKITEEHSLPFKVIRMHYISEFGEGTKFEFIVAFPHNSYEHLNSIKQFSCLYLHFLFSR